MNDEKPNIIFVTYFFSKDEGSAPLLYEISEELQVLGVDVLNHVLLFLGLGENMSQERSDLGPSSQMY